MGKVRGRSHRKPVRSRGGRIYPAKLERCGSGIAPKCKIWYNPYMAKRTGMCNRCWQSFTSK